MVEERLKNRILLGAMLAASAAYTSLSFALTAWQPRLINLMFENGLAYVLLATGIAAIATSILRRVLLGPADQRSGALTRLAFTFGLSRLAFALAVGFAILIWLTALVGNAHWKAGATQGLIFGMLSSTLAGFVGRIAMATQQILRGRYW